MDLGNLRNGSRAEFADSRKVRGHANPQGPRGPCFGDRRTLAGNFKVFPTSAGGGGIYPLSDWPGCAAAILERHLAAAGAKGFFCGPAVSKNAAGSAAVGGSLQEWSCGAAIDDRRRKVCGRITGVLFRGALGADRRRERGKSDGRFGNTIDENYVGQNRKTKAGARQRGAQAVTIE